MAEQAIAQQLVTFAAGGELFAVPIVKVQEIIRPTNIVHIPQSPPFVEGVINLRGKVLPVIDLKKRFAMTATTTEAAAKARIIVAELGGLTVGLTVDAVCEVMHVNSDSFENAPSIVSGVNQEFVRGIVKHGNEILIVLDLDKLLTHDETTILKTVR